MKAKHMFRKRMCWSEHSLPQRAIGGYACSRKTGDFLRKNRPQWMEWLTKAWGKSFRTLARKRMTPTETARGFLYSRDRVCAVSKWEILLSPGTLKHIWRWTLDNMAPFRSKLDFSIQVFSVSVACASVVFCVRWPCFQYWADSYKM